MLALFQVQEGRKGVVLKVIISAVFSGLKCAKTSSYFDFVTFVFGVVGVVFKVTVTIVGHLCRCYEGPR